MAGQTHSTSAETDRGERAAIETPHPPARRWARRTLSKQTVIALVCIAAALLGAAWLNTANTWAPEPRAALVVDETDLDLGDVWSQRAHKVTFPITNQSRRDLEIVRFETSCSCTRIEPPSLLIPAHESADVTLTLDYYAYDSSLASRPSFEFETEVVPILAGSDGPLSHNPLRFHAKVFNAIDISPKVVTFVEPIVVGQPPPAATIRVKTFHACKCIDLVAPRDVADVVFVGEDRNSGEQTWELRPRQDLPAGDLTFDVMAFATLNNNETLAPRYLPVVGEIVEDVHVAPKSIVLGAVQIGSSRSAQLELASYSGSSFQIRDIEVPESVSFQSKLPRDAIDHERFDLRYTASKLGPCSDEIAFLVVAADGREYRVGSKIVYVGQPQRKR